ncbi:MAG: hypothetical protein IPO32_11970 [Crocinitomicaceae bacterium]|jgi:hypothetical protein|nr:hypothetical protein [Crocinitomicaceae bacterium]MBK9592178.1 hypothetical protein [Crocinitomicaceae bacterium]
MDASGIIAILIILVCVSLWTIAFVQLNKYGGQKGIRQFFWMLLTMFAIAVLLFIFFVIPTTNCEGLLCGMDEALTFLIGCLFMLVVFPLILITVNVPLLKRQQKK